MSVNPVNCGMHGIVAPKQPQQKNPTDIIRDRMERRREIQEEIRYNDLCTKEKNGTITKEEMKELKEMKFIRQMEFLVNAPKPTVIYCA